jgi:hypothetical protein
MKIHQSKFNMSLLPFERRHLEESKSGPNFLAWSVVLPRQVHCSPYDDWSFLSLCHPLLYLTLALAVSFVLLLALMLLPIYHASQASTTMNRTPQSLNIPAILYDLSNRLIDISNNQAEFIMKNHAIIVDILKLNGQNLVTP